MESHISSSTEPTGIIFPSSSMQITLSPAALDSLNKLVLNRAGKDASEIINKLLTSVLQEFRSQHNTLLQLQAGNRNLSSYVQKLEEAKLQQISSSSSSCSTLLPDDEDEDNEDTDITKSSSARKRFFKGLNDLDPSARRKRKAKFCRSLIGLMEDYGMDIDIVSSIVQDMVQNPQILKKHVDKRAKINANTINNGSNDGSSSSTYNRSYNDPLPHDPTPNLSMLLSTPSNPSHTAVTVTNGGNHSSSPKNSSTVTRSSARQRQQTNNLITQELLYPPATIPSLPATNLMQADHSSVVTTTSPSSIPTTTLHKGSTTTTTDQLRGNIVSLDNEFDYLSNDTTKGTKRTSIPSAPTTESFVTMHTGYPHHHQRGVATTVTTSNHPNYSYPNSPPVMMMGIIPSLLDDDNGGSEATSTSLSVSNRSLSSSSLSRGPSAIITQSRPTLLSSSTTIPSSHSVDIPFIQDHSPNDKLSTDTKKSVPATTNTVTSSSSSSTFSSMNGFEFNV